MIKAGACYVVEMQFTNDSSVEFELFEDSNDADFFAASQALNFMASNFECNKVSAPKDYKDAYNSMIVRYQGASYDLVLDEFEEFNNKVITVLDPDNVIDIIRYERVIHPPTTNGSTKVTTTANGWSAGNPTVLPNVTTLGGSTVPVNGAATQYPISGFIKKILNCTPATTPSPSAASPIAVAPFVDVPCRVCKRNVNKSEKNCWHCGCDNPANS